MDHCAALFMLESIISYVVWLLVVVCDTPCHSIQGVLVFCCKAQTMYLVFTCRTNTYHFTPMYLHACMHRWWSVVSLFLLFNAGWTQRLSLVCCWWPSCCYKVPFPQDEGPPLWLWWRWIHSLALGSPKGPVVHSRVPREILWIWCENKGQGWGVYFAVCLMQLWPLWTCAPAPWG